MEYKYTRLLAQARKIEDCMKTASCKPLNRMATLDERTAQEEACGVPPLLEYVENVER